MESVYHKVTSMQKSIILEVVKREISHAKFSTLNAFLLMGFQKTLKLMILNWLN